MTATMTDPETPVETTARAPSPAPVGVDVALSPIMQQVHEAMTAPPGALTRPAPDEPAPLAPIVEATYQPPHIPRKFRGTAFDLFDVEKAGPEYRRELELALRAAKRWVSVAKQERPAMLALVGSQGNGKSTLLYAAVNLLALNGVRVFSRPWYRLADELRYGGPSPWAVDGADVEPHALRRQLYRARVVVIDEVRATSGTAFDDNELAKFACHAYDEGVAVFITTNVSPLSNVMGAAAADRFTCITLTAPSQRQSP